MNRIVTLIGYRGTGKSTIAPALAGKLSWEWLDSDQEIERSAGRSITDIFRDSGEATFRQLEHDLILAVLRERTELVLSVGGGAIMDDTIRAALKVAGPVVWLTASVDNILKRLHADDKTAEQRPRLTDAISERAEVREVLARREPLYADAATLTVNTDNADCDSVTTDVFQQVTTALRGETAP